MERQKFIGSYRSPVGMIVRSEDEEDVSLYPTNYNSTFMVNGFSKYNKFVYSSKFGFSVSRSFNSYNNCGMDSMLTACIADGIFISADRINKVIIEDEYIIRIADVIPGLSIKTVIVPGTPLHVRIHFVENNIGEIKLYDSGFSVPSNDVILHNENEITSCGGAYKSCVCSVLGTAQYKTIDNVPNCNICFPQSVLPTAEYMIREEKSIFATAVFGGSATDLESNLKVVLNGTEVEVYKDGKRLVIPIQNSDYIVEKHGEPILQRAKRFIKKKILS